MVCIPSYNQLCVACPQPDTYQDENKVHYSIILRKKKIKRFGNNWFVISFWESPAHGILKKQVFLVICLPNHKSGVNHET